MSHSQLVKLRSGVERRDVIDEGGRMRKEDTDRLLLQAEETKYPSLGNSFYGRDWNPGSLEY